MGFRVKGKGLEIRVQGLGFGVQSSVFVAWILGFRVQGLGFRAEKS